jgi:hypothetical protein
MNSQRAFADDEAKIFKHEIIESLGRTTLSFSCATITAFVPVTTNVSPRIEWHRWRRRHRRRGCCDCMISCNSDGFR